MLRGGSSEELIDRGVMATDARVAGVWQALQVLGAGLSQAFGRPVAGDPEDQLKSHVRPFIEQCGKALVADLIRLHIYGKEERFADAEEKTVLQGSARCTRSGGEAEADYPDDFEYDESGKTLRVGAGEFGPVGPEVWGFSVSGFQVVKSWLGYRMREGAGQRSSPLDEIRPTRWTAQFTRELLELLWVLEATVERWPALAEMLEAVVAGDCFRADELPVPEAWEREAPRVRRVSESSGVYAQTSL